MLIKDEINAKCKSKEFANVEFVSQEQIHWVVEAKSDTFDDRYNTVHKVFGELLKETGRDNRENCRYAILILHDAVAFYSNAFRAIDKTKFLEFGKLIPIATVLTSDSNGIKEFSWQIQLVKQILAGIAMRSTEARALRGFPPILNKK